MTCRKINTGRLRGIICYTPEFKAGDPRPEGYNAFYEWAEVQHKAGLRQKRCGRCGKWNFPQEMSDKTIESRHSKTKWGPEIITQVPMCKSCESNKK